MTAFDLSPTGRQTRSRPDERIILYRMATKSVQSKSHSRQNSRASSNISALRLEHYKHEQKLDQLEKEKKQCLHRLDGERHIFKMSVRLPKDSGMEQYKGTFRANGEYRESEGSSRPSEWTMEQSAKARKAHHDQCSPKGPAKLSKPIACKTVADLIAIMNGSTAHIDHTLSSDSSSSQVTPKTSPVRATSRGTSPGNDRNEKLRLLLENYEVFVPQNRYFNETTTKEDAGIDCNKTSGLTVPKWPGNSEESSVDTGAACYGTSTSSFSRSKSAIPTANKRISIPTGSKSETKVQIYGRKAASNTTPQQEPLCPKVRQLAASPNYITSGSFLQNDTVNRELQRNKFSWNTLPSNRFVKKKDSKGKVRIEPIASVDNAEHKFENGATASRMCSPEREFQFQSEPALSRVNSCKHRVSFASISEMETSIIGQNLTQYHTTKPPQAQYIQGFPHQSISPCAEMNSNSSHEKFTVNDFVEQDEERGATNSVTRESNAEHSSKDMCTKNKSSRKESEELPLKLFEPQFPIDYKKLFRFLYKQNNSNNRVRMNSTSSFKPSSTLSESGRRQHDVQEGKTAQSEGGEVTPVPLKRTAMMVLGKGLKKDENPVKVQQAKETRQKMDQFFARIQSSINPINDLTTRPNSPLPKPATIDKATKSHSVHKEYRRAAPWPVEIWC